MLKVRSTGLGKMDMFRLYNRTRWQPEYRIRKNHDKMCKNEVIYVIIGM